MAVTTSEAASHVPQMLTRSHTINLGYNNEPETNVDNLDLDQTTMGEEGANTQGKNRSNPQSSIGNTVVQPPPGIPPGLPQDMWMEYLTMQAKIQIEQAKIQADKEVQLKEIEIKAKEIEARAKESEDKADKGNKLPDIRFRKLKEKEDIDTYLRAFEHLAESNHWPKDTWATRLAPELTGKAFDIYANLSLDEAKDYDTLKSVILTKYEMNAETFRNKFRNRERKQNETVRELIYDLGQNFDNWVEYAGIDKNDAAGITQLIIMEQAMNHLPRDLTIYLRDHKVKNSKEMADMADGYIANRGGSEYWKRKEANKLNFRFNGKDQNRNNQYRSNKQQHKPNEKDYHDNHDNGGNRHGVTKPNGQNPYHHSNENNHPQSNRLNSNTNNDFICYACGKPGHTAKYCPDKKTQSNSNNKPLGANPKNGFKCQISNEQRHEHDEIEARCKKCQLSGTVNGKQVTIYRDSMCTQTAVAADIVPEKCYLGSNITVRGITGSVSLPLAEIDLQCKLVSGKVQVVVVPGLHREVLLGHDLDKTCGDILGREICVLTRQQAKQELDERLRAEVELFNHKLDIKDLGLDSELIEAPENVQNLGLNNKFEAEERPMDAWIDNSVLDNLFNTENPETVKNVRHDIDNTENRPKETLAHSQASQKQAQENKEWPNIDRNNLKFMQHTDESLKGVCQRLTPIEEIDKYRVCFYEKQNVLMRKWQTNKATENDNSGYEPIHQIIVPKKYRPNILEMAHDISWSGHMGVEKTKQRILAHFYWPGVFKDVANYCRSCPKCQMLEKSKVSRKAPLIPMPIIDTPFKRVGIDIVGPFNRSRKGNKYLLTICDYATRYPEAIPISNMRVDTVTNALLTVFARVGLPEEIVHDQGANFMSQVMASICKKLQITQLKSAIYHQQTNGVTERFHGTLKNAMRSLSEQERKSWDEYIPHFLFAYRDVPCQTTGFSPFQLLYGRQVRGPLSVIKQNWDTDVPEQKDIVTHLTDMRKRITGLMKEANKNLENNQKKMKHHYDKDAVHREFEPGEQVLVFLPISASKLDSKWQGPYTVITKINKVNYLIKMHDKRKSRRVFHINMLKKWYNRDQDTYMSECYCITGDIDELSSHYKDTLDTELNVHDESDIEIQPTPVRNMDEIIPNCSQTQDWKDIAIPQELSDLQKQDLESLFENHESIFSDVPGRTHLVSHTIRTTTDKPVRQKIYRTPQALRDKIKDELDSMLSLGVIEPSNSPYASPITVVLKPGGKEIRLCSDLRAINQICVFDPYEMPRIDDILDQVSNSKYISTLDLTKGFYQVPLDPESRAKTAFVTPFGQFQYTVLPFGLQNSSSTFMRLVDQVLNGCQEFAQAYIDDICIYSNTWEEHLKHVDEVLTRIKNAGLTVKPKKCHFGQNEVTYLGHVIGNGTVKPKLDKIEAVTDFPRPITKKQVRAFLGLTGYYRKFIPMFADIARPLTDLTKKCMANTVIWNENCENAFVTLKKSLTSEPILCTPDFSAPFILQTDASDFGLGAILSQIDTLGNERPIVYLSRKMLDRERKYTVSEKECLAIVWAIGKLQYYLYGHTFTVYSDHQSLTWLERNRSNNNRLTRWFLALQPFKFQVLYKKGIANTNADGLSRA